ncbi:protein kinase domain-containing protein [Micromonospora coxensis]|uniref:Protein kinase domain-containing protein n=1 Tax=Micromonospora coxensis TaxID=356852 RepID=A0A1C5K0Y8_9ACTN|nr:serine/threonine-protein kinase [Micromonospora coxensis]SCG76199.1 Protein kinase domain-containing protein [Micromonospora coxensis]
MMALSPEAPQERPENNPRVRLTGLTPERVLAGGMSLVYLCRSTVHDDGVVAVKRLRPQLFSTEDDVARFMRECFLWLQLGRHPNIVTAISAHKAPHEPPMLVLEYVPGSLREALRGGPLGVERTLRLAWEVTQGLRYARAQLPDFVHADLKPENILLDDVSAAKITDLGLARALLARPSGDLTDDDDAGAGTPLYMAPEQVDGPAVPASDIYALGCVLFEMLSGIPPYGVPDNTVDYRLQHRYGTPLPLSTLSPHVPADLAALIHRCLAKRPHERPDPVEIGRVVRAVAAPLRVSLPAHEPSGPDVSTIREAIRGLVNLGFADDAIDSYNRSTARRPEISDDEHTRYLMVRALNDQRRWQEAEEHLDWLAERMADADDVWQGALTGERARVSLAAGRRAEALQLFARSARMIPQSSVAWSNLAILLHGEDLVEDAVVAMQMAMLRSLNLFYLGALAGWLVDLGRPREALRYAEVAVKIHPRELAARGLVLLAERAMADLPDGDRPASPLALLGDVGTSVRDSVNRAVDHLLSDDFQG